MSRFSGFSEKSFFKRISKIWAKILNFSLNFWKKLDFIDFSIRVLERLNFQSGVMYIFKFLVLGNNKRVFRRFAFIQVKNFFLKIKKDFNKKLIYCESNLRPSHPLASNLTQTVGRFDMCVTPRTYTNRHSFCL